MQSEAPLAGVETKILYKTSDSHYKKSEDSEIEKIKNESYVILNDDMSGYYHTQSAKKQNRRSSKVDNALIIEDKKLRKHKTKSVYESFTSGLSESTFHSLNQFKEMTCIDPGDIGFEEEKRNRTGVRSVHHQNKVYKKIKKTLRPDVHDIPTTKDHLSKKQNHSSKELDYDFIADIIKRQYKPVQIGRKFSDLSQFSAPECRDREFYFNNNDETNIRPPGYNCIVSYDNHDNTKHLNCSDHCGLSDGVEGKPYGYKRKSRINRRKFAFNNYNDSEVYDLVPVKERTSPKSRRKFFEDNMALPSINREVLPSPRSHRPKLNLQAQYHTDFEEVLDDMVTVKKSIPKRILHQQLIENENYPLPQPRRVLSKKQMVHDNEIDYVIRPYKRITPNITVQHYDEDMNISPPAEPRFLPIRQLQQYDNEYEVGYLPGPSKKLAKRHIQQYEIEDEIDYNTPPNRFSLNKRMQRYENDYEYMTRPSRRISPKRTMQKYVNEDGIQLRRCSSRRISPKRIIHQAEMNDVIGNDNRPELKQNRNNVMSADVANEMGASSFQYSTSVPQENTLTPETPLSKTQDTISEDKTDKALCEIKDILQSFLREIKKESQSEKSDISNKATLNGGVPPDASGPNNSFNDYAAMQCPMTSSPFMSEFANNPCCYPIIPLCPMSYMQNGFPAPNSSFTCTHCATKLNETTTNKCNETTCNENISKHDATEETFQTDTNELIKEIYKFVSQSPTFGRKKAVSTERLDIPRNDLKPSLKSRGAGGSGEVYNIQNAKVGTPRTSCVSKSCEAIAQKSSEAYTSETNASYSETVLEKASHEATITTTESITETDTTEAELEKAKLTKFSKAMKSWSIFKKKKKKDVIEELSESEQDREPKRTPFHQNVTNYMMHGQEYFVPPPVGPNFNYNPQNYRPLDCVNYGLPYNPGLPDYSMSMPTQQKYRNGKMATAPPQEAYPYSYYHGQCPTAPHLSGPYDTYGQMPQGPLCLQEVEVKSIGCQSEKKLSFFRKLGMKNQNQPAMPQYEYAHKTCSTQTAQYTNNKPGGLFKWPKPMDRRDTLNFNYKTEKKLAAGDMKMRKAMIKKMFYKKNPFSTNNLIIKTLLGRDRASYGEAPTMYRPRLFM